MRPPPTPTIPALLAPLLLALCAPMAALAQAPPPVETLLRLAETAEVARPPNELRATLRAEARASTAAEAQAAVNRAIAVALERAHATPSVRASTGGYWTSSTQEPNGWQASQILTLRGEDAAPLLDLVGALQGGDLALVGLGWTLSHEAERFAREEAGRIALGALQRRASAVATQLGMTVAGLREVRLDAPQTPGPRTVAMAAPARAAAAPVATPEDAVVSATVEADVVLRPGK